VPEIVEYVQKGVIIALVIYSIILHEIAHAYAAFRLGDPTAAARGRLTLNPIKHIDPFFTIIMPLLFYFSTKGMFVLGSAKPVPINPFNFRNPRKGMMISGIAGPSVNLAIAILCALLVRLLVLVPWISSRFLLIFAYVGMMNMLLLVFNMLPIPPLDGSRVLSYFLPRDLQEKYDRLEQFGLFLVLIVLIVFRPQLDVLFGYARDFFLMLAGIG